jgi:hypothetical protein
MLKSPSIVSKNLWMASIMSVFQILWIARPIDCFALLNISTKPREYSVRENRWIYCANCRTVNVIRFLASNTN